MDKMDDRRKTSCKANRAKTTWLSHIHSESLA